MKKQQLWRWVCQFSWDWKIDSDFWSSYWLAHSEIVNKRIARTQLERKISIQCLAESSVEQGRARYKTEAAIDSIKKESALRTQKRLLLKRAERVTSDGQAPKSPENGLCAILCDAQMDWELAAAGIPPSKETFEKS